MEMKREKASIANRTHFCRVAWQNLGPNTNLDIIRSKAQELMGDPHAVLNETMLYKAKRQVYGAKQYDTKVQSFTITSDTLQLATKFIKSAGSVDQAMFILRNYTG